jgi:hypothetical protein
MFYGADTYVDAVYAITGPPFAGIYEGCFDNTAAKNAMGCGASPGYVNCGGSVPSSPSDISTCSGVTTQISVSGSIAQSYFNAVSDASTCASGVGTSATAAFSPPDAAAFLANDLSGNIGKVYYPQTAIGTTLCGIITSSLGQFYWSRVLQGGQLSAGLVSDFQCIPQSVSNAHDNLCNGEQPWTDKDGDVNSTWISNFESTFEGMMVPRH